MSEAVLAGTDRAGVGGRLLGTGAVAVLLMLSSGLINFIGGGLLLLAIAVNVPRNRGLR
jgi:hypothetical protein